MRAGLSPDHSFKINVRGKVAASENLNVTFAFALSPQRLAVLALTAALAGCSSLGDLMSSQKVDYRSAATRTKGLDVPPDLTQLAREGRYQPTAAVVSAAGAGTAPAAAAQVAPVNVAPGQIGDMQIVRDGQARWLSVPIAPDALWPQVKAFWVERGFTIASEDSKAGVMETDWAENRAKLPVDGIRAVIGKVFDSLYDTGERDLFRTRIERSATGSEVYISHRGVREVIVDKQQEQARWTTRPSDPQLEAEFLARLMTRLGAKEEVARTALASPVAQTPLARASAVGNTAALEINEDFERAWRRVGLALDRIGFTVEDRNRADGLYFVRYVDPKSQGSAKSFFTRLFGSEEAGAAQRYRLAVKTAGANKTVLTVLNDAGVADNGETAQQIAKVLLTELR